jgi:hypothetical protein
VVTEADLERRRRFEALFKEHVAGIASYCRWQLRSPGDVDDAVAEVFLVAWRRLDDVPRGEAAGAVALRDGPAGDREPGPVGGSSEQATGQIERPTGCLPGRG